MIFNNPPQAEAYEAINLLQENLFPKNKEIGRK